MNDLELLNIYYRSNNDIPEYLDVFFETTLGYLKNNTFTFDKMPHLDFDGLIMADGLNNLKEQYGSLYIDAAKVSYDGNLYLLISGKFILALEYILNSNFAHSLQEFRIIEDIYSANKLEFDEFNELEYTVTINI